MGRLYAALAVVLLALPLVPQSADAQGVCHAQPAVPSCQSPGLQAQLKRLLYGVATVNISYASPPASASEVVAVMLSHEGPKFQSVPARANIRPGQKVDLLLALEPRPDVVVGTYPIRLRAAANGTDFHKPGEAFVNVSIHVDWAVHATFECCATVRAVPGGFEAPYWLNVTSNGPLEFAIGATNDGHVVEFAGVSLADDLRAGGTVNKSGVLKIIASDPYAHFKWSLTPPAFFVDACDADAERSRCEFTRTGTAGHYARQEPSSSDSFWSIPALDNFAIPSLDSLAVPNVFLPLVLSLLAAALVGLAAFSVNILRRSRGELGTRLLAAYLGIHCVAFTALLVPMLVETLSLSAGPLRMFVDALVGASILAALLVLPVLLLVFAATHPLPLPFLRQRRWLAAVPPAAALVLVAIAILHWAQNGDRGAAGQLLVSLLLGYLAAASLAALLIFRLRAKAALTVLERTRHAFMARAVAAPLAIIAIALEVTLLLPASDLQGLLFVPLFLAMAYVPPLTMSYGVLKYRVVDLRQGIRRTVRHSLVGLVFFVVFFVLSELAEGIVVRGTSSRVFGLLGAAVLVLAFRPLEAWAARVALRIIPTQLGADRRAEVYRATFEDFSADRTMTDRERELLDALARSLGLAADAAREVETLVQEERSVMAGSRSAATVEAA